MKLTDMSKFEKENENIAVNVLAYSEASIYPLRISKEENRKYVINRAKASKWRKEALLPDKQHKQATIESSLKSFDSGVCATSKAKKSLHSMKSIDQEMMQLGSRCQMRIECWNSRIITTQ